MKRLRSSADARVLRIVYTALCESVISYAIAVWGGAAKSHLIKLERAQRSILKATFRKPFRYSTRALYQETRFLSVRQLFILKVAVAFHRVTLNSSIYKKIKTKRIYKIPLPTANFAFTKRFQPFISTYVYNKISHECNLKYTKVEEAKRKIKDYLMTLDYKHTELTLNTPE